MPNEKLRWRGPTLLATRQKTMSEVFSRNYLLGLPAAHRKSQLERVITPILSEVHGAAMGGKTSYAFNMQRAGGPIRYRPHPQMQEQGQPPLPPRTVEELLPLFKEKFPYCAVTYEEVWIDDTPTRRYLSKQILIDWS